MINKCFPTNTEINKAAGTYSYSNCDSIEPNFGDVEDAFIEGAKWALSYTKKSYES